ncbi:MAG TPA: rhomboid family intramembrane serine protease [Acidimicrobiales bacterium]|nr:rhomboid family intramembrane serine protease [Acidimicrobiales bacterium]
MTACLIGICIFVFLVLQSSAFQRPTLDTTRSGDRTAVLEANRFVYRWTAIPCEVTSGETVEQGAKECDGTLPFYADEHGKNVWLSVFFSMWLHANLLHIAGNMLYLWIFGRLIEDRLGPLAFLAIYLVGGMIATFTFCYAHYHSTGPGLGASGAIAAIMGVAVVLQPRRRLLSVLQTPGAQVAYVPAWAVLGLFFASQFFYGDDTVAWQAHVGGMLFGVLCGLGIWLYGRRRGRTQPLPTVALTPTG